MNGIITQFFKKLLIILRPPGKPTIFLIADTHFDHANIIKYCRRPYKNVNHMNISLKKRWNSKIRKKDTIYFLGDFVNEWAPGWRIGYWINRLNGKIIFIEGNHDKKVKKKKSHQEFTFNGIIFLFMHIPNPDPDNLNELKYFRILEKFKKSNPNGWFIYGHKHNNNLDKYPFFDPYNRRINVSVECIDYQPVPFSYLVNLIKTENKKLKTISEGFD